MIKVLFYGSCWTTNIGNAFVNLGAIHALTEALGDRGEVYHFGGMSSYLFSRHGKTGNNLSLAKLARFDYIVNAGMTQCVEHCQVAERLCRQFGSDGAKLILLGSGAGRYRQDEADDVRRMMKNIPLHAFASRDTYSFEKYGDLAPYSHDGIDCAFFAADFHRPIPLDVTGYNVLCFDSYQEPSLVNAGSLPPDPDEGQGAAPAAPRVSLLRRLQGARGKQAPLPPVDELDMNGRLVLRTHHSTWSHALPPRYFASPDCMVSDLPGDYLSLYAQADTVYADRVHACIPALAYGNKAMLVKQGEPRVQMFARVGAPNITGGPVRIDAAKLRSDKEALVSFLREVFSVRS
jgi:hypothetical protein